VDKQNNILITSSGSDLRGLIFTLLAIRVGLLICAMGIIIHPPSVAHGQAWMGPIGVIAGILFTASAVAIAWLSGGRSYIDARNRVFVTEVPLLGASKDSFDELPETTVGGLRHDGIVAHPF